VNCEKKAGWMRMPFGGGDLGRSMDGSIRWEWRLSKERGVLGVNAGILL